MISRGHSPFHSRTLARAKSLIGHKSIVRDYAATAERAIPPQKLRLVPTSGTYPKGFKVASALASVKSANKTYPDLALLVSETPAAAAGVFTTNAFKAAPVTVSQEILKQTCGVGLRGVVINSGCANAVTGKAGLAAAKAMVHSTDASFGQENGQPSKTLVMSTGVIGQQLPNDHITDTIPTMLKRLGDTHESWLSVASAICTTDTFPKLVSKSFTLPSHPETKYTIAGIAKGAGMIHPNMATLLGVVCTDARVEPDALTSLLQAATKKSFNCITIDGDTSTNDTINIFANGVAAPDGQKPVGAESSEDFVAMQTVLTSVMSELAQLVVRDGEGATKFVKVSVTGAIDDAAAKSVANTIATSPLVKTALYGQDANWGRILAAIGRSDASHTLQPEKVSVKFRPQDDSADLRLITRGEPELPLDEVRAKEVLSMEDLEIIVNLDDVQTSTAREGEAVVWTCDYSHEYITINGDYRT